MGLKLVGLELEGGWWDLPSGTKLYPNGVLTHDVSVVQPKNFSAGINHWGEAVSPPLKVKEVEGWLTEYYPTHIPATTNPGTPMERSCGLHIHTSFDYKWEYRAFVRKSWQDFALGEWEEWGKKHLPKGHIFFHRLAGKNRFCTREFQPYSQMMAREKGHNRPDRRTIFNYPWGYLKTIEFRMLPMFPDALLTGSEVVAKGDKNLAVMAVMEHLKMMRGWLSRFVAESERKMIYRGVISVTAPLPMQDEKEEILVQRRKVAD